VTGSPGGMQHSKAPLLSCFLCELSGPWRINSSTALYSSLHLPDRCHLQASISGTKHKAFRSLTSHIHRQSTEQQESEDNINVASFKLNSAVGKVAIRLSNWTRLLYITTSQLQLFCSMTTRGCWHNSTFGMEENFTVFHSRAIFQPTHNKKFILINLFWSWCYCAKVWDF